MDAPRVRTATHGYHVRCRGSAALWCELIVNKRVGLPRWATLGGPQVHSNPSVRAGIIFTSFILTVFAPHFHSDNFRLYQMSNAFIISATY